MKASNAPVCCSAVIFLDFDGVIQTWRGALASGRGFSSAPSDPVLVAAIARVCETGVRIVVSSSWRDDEKITKGKLTENGLIKYLHEDWRTSEYRASQAYKDRPLEIEEWLLRHPEVTRFQILDDDAWAWTDEQAAMWRRCDPEDGMPAKEMKKMLEWAGVARRLNAKQPSA